MKATAFKLFVTCAVLVFAQVALAKDMVMTNEVAASHWKNEYMKQVAKTIKNRTNGKITPKVFPAGQIYTDQEALGAMGTGAVQMVWPVAVRLETIDRRVGVIDLPFALSQKTMSKACYRSQVADMLSSFLDKANLKVINLLRTSDLFFMFSNQDIDKLSEFNGEKIRVTGGRIYLDTLRAIGASPISMAASEMSTALAQGTIDGVFSSAAGWADMLGPSAKYAYHVPGLALATYAVVVDKGWLNSLSDKDAKIVQQSVLDIADKEWTETSKKDQALIDKMKAGGASYEVADKSEIKRWKRKTRSVVKHFAKAYPEAMKAFKSIDASCH